MSWFNKVKEKFSSASVKITQAVSDLLNTKALDTKSLHELEETLLKADLGSNISKKIAEQVKQLKFEKNLSPQQAQDKIAHFIAANFNGFAPAGLTLTNPLTVILVCGVNGNGKTTTIGKLAHIYNLQNKKVALAACDTFRAAAVEQLHHWAKITNVSFIQGEKIGADPASVAYKAVSHALENKVDVLFIDTAGRLNNNKNLMEELSKIKKVLTKFDPSFPHYCLLVLDGTTGQNALNQVKDFKALIPELNGLIITKMDSTAKAGIALAIIEQFQIPIYFIGTGEKIQDLEQFNAVTFAYKLLQS